MSKTLETTNKQIKDALEALVFAYEEEPSEAMCTHAELWDKAQEVLGRKKKHPFWVNL